MSVVSIQEARPGIPAGELPKRGRPVVSVSPREYSHVAGIPRAAFSHHSAALEAVGIASLLLLSDFEHDAWENGQRWKNPSPGLLGSILGVEDRRVSKALTVARAAGLTDADGSLAGWKNLVTIPREATRIDARRLGYAGLSLLAALAYQAEVWPGSPAVPRQLSHYLGLNLSCVEISIARRSLMRWGYIDSEWRRVAGK